MNTPAPAPPTKVIPPETGYYYLQSLRASKLPRGQLRELQARRLRAALTFAASTVSIYRDMFRERSLTPADVRSADDLRKLPLYSKADIMRGQEEAMKEGGAAGARLITSSGTTGRPSALARSREAVAVNRALGFRKMTELGIRPWSKVATLWAPQKYWRSQVERGVAKPVTGLYDLPITFLGRTLPNILTLWVDPRDPGRDRRTLASFDPEYVYSRPSHLRRMARKSGPNLGISPKAIMATGEIVTETGVRELRSAYGAKVIRSYGAAGVGSLAGECLYESGLHTWEDYKVYEVLKDGDAVSPGEVGELVITVLHRDVIPLIRFRTGDLVRLGADDRCECGSSMRRLSSIEGREDDCVVGKDGERFLATEVSDYLESKFGLRDFQLVQRGMFEFGLLLTADNLEWYKGGSGVKEYLEEIVGSPVNLEVRPRSDDDYWVKTRPVVCKVL